MSAEQKRFRWSWNRWSALVLSVPLVAAILLSGLGVAASAQAPQNQYLPLSNYLPTLDVTPPHFLRIEQDGVKNTSDFFDQVQLATSNRIFRFNTMPIPVFYRTKSTRLRQRSEKGSGDLGKSHQFND